MSNISEQVQQVSPDSNPSSNGYLEWNDRLAYHFFNKSKAGQPVHLYVNGELITRLGRQTGANVQDFIDVVQTGPPGMVQKGLCQMAYGCYEAWKKQRNRDYPPYIAYLCLFVLAAGLEGDFAPHAYYPRLWTLLGQPGKKGELPSFKYMLSLWDDLERWSIRDQHGELGLFTVQLAGKWINVGVPVAQVILSETERTNLPELFVAARLDPAAQPSDANLVRILSRLGHGHLRPRTLGLLGRSGDDESKDVFELLLASIREVLSTWDGSIEVEEVTGTQRERVRHTYGGLRLSCRLDRVAGRLSTFWRCAANRELPEEGLLLRSTSSGDTYSAEEEVPGWSSPLINSETGTVLDAASFNWTAPLQFQDERLRWKFGAGDSEIRILVEGRSEGLSGLVEIYEVPPGSRFYLLTTIRNAGAIAEWGQLECEGFREVEITVGLPAGWRLFQIDRALSDASVRDVYPLLAFSSVLRFSITGGFRSSGYSTYFSFGLPSVRLEGGTGTEQVFCNGIPVTSDPDARLFRLPTTYPAGSTLELEVRREKRGEWQPLRRRTLYVANEVDWRGVPHQNCLDKFGVLASGDERQASFTGATVIGVRPQTHTLSFPPQVFAGHKTYFIGPCYGQIAVWPDEDIPAEWEIIWAVTMTLDSGSAVYCGTRLVQPSATRGKVEPRKMALWKEVLWYWRKRINLAPGPGLSKLWKQYREAARDAR